MHHSLALIERNSHKDEWYVKRNSIIKERIVNKKQGDLQLLQTIPTIKFISKNGKQQLMYANHQTKPERAINRRQFRTVEHEDKKNKTEIVPELIEPKLSQQFEKIDSK